MDKIYAEQMAKITAMHEESMKKMQETAEAQAKAALTKPEVKVGVKVDGREVARATSKAQDEVEARSGAKAEPWQRRKALVTGAIAVRR